MGELIAEMKDSVESEDKTDEAVASPKMNATNDPGCDSNEAVNIPSTSKLEPDKENNVSNRRRNQKIFKKFASDLERSRESILEADREASGRTVLEHLEATDWAKCPVCFAPISREKLGSHLFTSHYTEFYKPCSKSNKSDFHFAD